MADVSDGDPDTPAVLDLLREVAGGGRDPDVALAELLVRIDLSRPSDVDKAVAGLIRDAYPD